MVERLGKIDILTLLRWGGGGLKSDHVFFQLLLFHIVDLYTEGCMGEQTSLEFNLTFGDVLLHKLVQAY